MIETSFLVIFNGFYHFETPWSADETEVDAQEAELVGAYPANQGFEVFRQTREVGPVTSVEITQPGEDNGPVVA